MEILGIDISSEVPSRNYESVIIMDPSATEEEQKALFKKNKQIVEDFKGEMHAVDTWGQRALANAIDKVSRGTFFHSTFKANSTCIAELERTMKINDKVLRYVHTRLDEGVTLDKHMESFKESLVETRKRFEEAHAKNQARKAARKPRRPYSN